MTRPGVARWNGSSRFGAADRLDRAIALFPRRHRAALRVAAEQGFLDLRETRARSARDAWEMLCRLNLWPSVVVRRPARGPRGLCEVYLDMGPSRRRISPDVASDLCDLFLAWSRPRASWLRLRKPSCDAARLEGHDVAAGLAIAYGRRVPSESATELAAAVVAVLREDFALDMPLASVETPEPYATIARTAAGRPARKDDPR